MVKWGFEKKMTFFFFCLLLFFHLHLNIHDPLFYIHQDNLWKYYFIRFHELYPVSFQTNEFRDNICEYYRKFMIKDKNLGLVKRLYPNYKDRGHYKYINKGFNIIRQFQKDIDMNIINRKKKIK